MKNSFKKIVSIAAAVTMLGSVASLAVSANETEYVAKDATSIADFQFEGTGAKYVIVPATVTSFGNQAFLTSVAINEFLVGEGLQFDTENQKAIEEYIAKVIKFGGKEADWTEDELKTVDEWFEKNLKLAGFDTTNKEASVGEAVVALIKEYNKGADSKLEMSQKSKDNFGIWIAALPTNITIVAPKDSEAAKYAAARAPMGVESKVLGDANGDNKINVMDASKIAQNLAAKKANSPWADYNLDGKVNVMDASKIARDLASGVIKGK